MFLATTKVIGEDTYKTFVCQDHAIGELITLIQRYQNLVNEINGTDTVFQLLSVSDVGTSITPSTLQALGATLLSRDLIREMKAKNQQKKGMSLADLEASILDASKDASESDDADNQTVSITAYNLPDLHNLNPLSTYADIPRLHPIVRNLFETEQLWIDDFSYVLIPGRHGDRLYMESECKGPCFLVRIGDSFTLSKDAPIDQPKS